MKFINLVKLPLLLFCCILLLNCENTKDSNTNAPIPKDKMKVVLTDLYLAEAAANLHKITNDSALMPHKSYYFDEIFEKHNVTQQQYEEAYEYYTDEPELFLEIYNEMYSEIDSLRESFKTEN